MRDLFRTSALALVLSCAAAVASAQQPAQQQQQPQSTPAQNSAQPVDQEKERAKADAKDEQSGKVDGQLGNTAGRTPERGQAMGMAPSEASTDGGGSTRVVPGAVRETMPAKYSEDNAKRAEGAIMQTPVLLNDEQNQAIWQAVGQGKATASAEGKTVHAETGVFLPSAVAAEEFPDALQNSVPSLRGLKYVKVDDKVLLVQPANGIVRGVIEK